VNRFLEDREDPRRLEAPLSQRELRGALPRGRNVRGVWYSLRDGEGWTLVFSLMAEGLRVPCAAMVSPEGLVEELIPLTLAGEEALSRLSPGITGAYIRRIEGGGS
jgi:hypothetical protein